MLPGRHNKIQVGTFAFITWAESMISGWSHFNQEMFFVWNNFYFGYDKIPLKYVVTKQKNKSNLFQ